MIADNQTDHSAATFADKMKDRVAENCDRSDLQMNSTAAHALLAKAPPLEMVELEMALAVQDVLSSGFDNAVRKAAETIGGILLFDMPMFPGSAWQRIAAVSAGLDDQAQVLLVMLGKDGLTLQVEDAGYSSSPFAGFALTHVEMLMHMASSNLSCIDDDGADKSEAESEQSGHAF